MRPVLLILFPLALVNAILLVLYLAVQLPPCLPHPAPDTDALAYAADVPTTLGRELIVLVQAGAAALGLYEDHAELRHRVLKRYVVRGNGKAQPTHLKTKGKSRYGSRLRLQNHRRQLDEIHELLADWDRDDGPFDVIWRGAVDRTWAELCAHDDGLPFDARDPRIRRVPLTVHTPGLDELRRVRHELTHGRILSPDPGAR